MGREDLKKIKKIVKEAVIDALTVELTFEKRRNEKTGLPQSPEIIKEKVFLPAWITQYIHFVECALRGMQETTDLMKNNIASNNEKLENIAEVLLASQANLKSVASLSDLTKKFIPMVEKKLSEKRLLSSAEVIELNSKNESLS